jgi:hypothetical protein
MLLEKTLTNLETSVKTPFAGTTTTMNYLVGIFGPRPHIYQREIDSLTRGLI